MVFMKKSVNSKDVIMLIGPETDVDLSPHCNGMKSSAEIKFKE